MYKLYYQTLLIQFIAIILPNLGIAVASLFAYPSICVLIGIDSSRALAFPARSVTLALATPVVNNLGITMRKLFDIRWIYSFSCGPCELEWHYRRSCGWIYPQNPSNSPR
jgi:LrgB-like family